MTAPSRAAFRKTLLRTPASSLSPEPSPHPNSASKKQKRPATVYDAVAGRISSTGFIPRTPVTSAHRDTLSSTTHPVPPEEVLFRRKNAPPRYQESDFYFAHEALDPKNQRLPDSELLKAVHGYAADFYKRAIDGGGKGDWRSLDETALLAVGILLEEGARECLGGSGDLVFVEGEDGGVGLGPGGRESRSVVGRSEAARKSGVTRRKRRKVDMDDGERGDG